MAEKRRVIRKVERSTAVDFDEQLWPINCTLLIMTACMAGVVIAQGDFEARNLLHNAWTQLAGLGLLAVALVGVTVYLRRRVHTRRVQLAVMLALFLHFLLITGMHVYYFAVWRPSHEVSDWIDDQPPITVPDYGRAEHQEVVQEITRPTEVVTPDREQEETRQAPETEQPALSRPTPQQPTTAAQQPPNAAQVNRAATSVPRRSEQRSGQQISRSDLAARAVPEERLAQPAPPVPEPRAAQPTNARPTPLVRRSTDPPQVQRRATAEPTPSSPQPAQTAQMQRRQRQTQPTPDQPTSQSVARQRAQRPSFEQPEISQPRVAAAPAARQPQLRPTATVSRTSTAPAAGRRTTEPQVSASASAPIARSAPARATPQEQPQVSQVAGQAVSRAAAQMAVPQAEAAPQSLGQPAAAQNATPNLQPAATQVAQQRTTQLPDSNGRPAPDSAPAASPTASVARAQPRRAESSVAPSAAANPNLRGARIARATTAASGAPAAQAAPAPTVGTSGSSRAVASASGPRAAATSVARSEPGGISTTTPRNSAGTSGPSGTASGSLPAVSAARAASSQISGAPTPAALGQTVPVARASSGRRLGGAASAAEAVRVAQSQNTGDAGGQLQASATGTTAQRMSNNSGGPAARRADVTGEPAGAEGAAQPAVAAIARGDATAGGGAPSLAAGSTARPLGRAASAVEPGGALAEAAGPAAASGAPLAAGQPAGPSANAQLTGSGRTQQPAALGALASKGTNDDAPAVGGQGEVARASIAAARGAEAGPRPATGTLTGRTPARAASGAPDIAGTAASAPDATSVATSSGGGSPAGEPSGPSSGDVRRVAQLPGAALAKGAADAGPAGDVASAAVGGAPGPRRAASGAGEGPQLAAASAAQPTRRGPALDFPGGAALADAAGPTPGGVEDDGSQTGAPGGPAVGSVARTQDNALPVRVAANPGLGGLSSRPVGDLGIPNRLARADSDVVSTDVGRFKLERTQSRLNVDAAVVAEPAPAFRQRDPEKRAEVAQSRGGSAASEWAVEAGLDFLARHQMPDGRWSLHRYAEGKPYRVTPHSRQMEADTAATGMALLAFLGAGYTHQEEKYRQVVSAGLQHLLAHQKPDGDLFSGGSRYVWLYSHGIAAIALCEAYGMTRDPQLREPAQRALEFIVAAQHPTQGGWRYAPRVGTDTSVSGWQLMALKSGQMAGLDVPESAYALVRRWLDGAHPRGNASLYVYRPTAEQAHQRTPSRTMTAEALLMRLYLGWKTDHPDMERGADYLEQNLPTFGTVLRKRRDCYYWYYATQVMFQKGGHHWDSWNGRMRPLLTGSQQKTGPLRGSWDPLGDIPDRWGAEAGRIYTTAMHLLMLEIYYRHLPLFTEEVQR